MKVKELKDNLAYYDDNAEVVFTIVCDIEPISITKTKSGWCTVHLNSKLKPTYIVAIHDDCHIALEVNE